MTDYSPKANAPLYAEGQDLGHATINEQVNKLEQTGYLVVQSSGQTDPSSLSPSPTAGNAYLVGSSAIGAWLGHDGEIAIYDGSGWIFRPLANGELYTDLSAGTYGTVIVNKAGTAQTVHVIT